MGLAGIAGVSHLGELAQQGLKGKAIAKALTALRLKAIEELLNKSG